MHKITTRSNAEAILQTIKASFSREIKSRLGPNPLAWLWLLLEPITYVATFWFIFSITGRTSIHGVSVPEFILSGALPFLFFRMTLTKCCESVRANKAVLAYKPITPFICFTARYLVELTVFLISAVFLFVLIFIINKELTLSIDISILPTITLLAIFSYGVSFCVMVLSHMFPIICKLLPPLTRIMFFLSGVFYTSTMIPQKAEKILQYNPMFAFIENLREQMFTNFKSSIDVNYLPLLTLLLLSFSVFLYNSQKERKLLEC